MASLNISTAAESTAQFAAECSLFSVSRTIRRLEIHLHFCKVSISDQPHTRFKCNSHDPTHHRVRVLIDGCQQPIFLISAIRRRLRPAPGAGRRIFVTGLAGSPIPHSLIATVNT